ncbi:uncharacterized protein BO88DRAFT_475204 [Aspergillus vadensis CBS 113365]|uniref:Uncharacterized protein n=1 Tax=Aspergillus vadensis (strain CBS 113365 / IMI 142717 / IBT 24658) TaxID=1448311 RepID=A0A319AX39_ASPVC|nr:hypothetical protein BO88DRAFT_475204 [Aspergillus vadensis CBS 113365]PYH63951.1 hypothetical protein BO88DRAFT_475204 [Aspergillus vadensis CBS 113365]
MGRLLPNLLFGLEIVCELSHNVHGLTCFLFRIGGKTSSDSSGGLKNSCTFLMKMTSFFSSSVLVMSDLTCYEGQSLRPPRTRTFCDQVATLRT